MKILRPLWTEGALLSPQQFQQQARWESDVNDCLAHLSLNHPWGVLHAEFDQDAQRLNRLKAQHLRLRLPDGSLSDTDVTDNLPPAIDLAQILTGPQRSVEVLLALPLRYANGGNCLMMEEKAERPMRYRREWVTTQDLFGNEAEERLALTLRFDSEENGDYLTCPLTRLVQDGQGNWAVGTQFVPPLLSFNTHKGLLSRLSNLLVQLRAKCTRLVGMRRESNQRMADFAVTDVQFELFAVLRS